MTLTTLMMRLLGRLKVCSTSLLTQPAKSWPMQLFRLGLHHGVGSTLPLTDPHILRACVWPLAWLLGKCISTGLRLYKLYLYRYLKWLDRYSRTYGCEVPDREIIRRIMYKSIIENQRLVNISENILMGNNIIRTWSLRSWPNQRSRILTNQNLMLTAIGHPQWPYVMWFSHGRLVDRRSTRCKYFLGRERCKWWWGKYSSQCTVRWSIGKVRTY